MSESVKPRYKVWHAAFSSVKKSWFCLFENHVFIDMFRILKLDDVRFEVGFAFQNFM
jgi:hypothetical protein